MHFRSGQVCRACLALASHRHVQIQPVCLYCSAFENRQTRGKKRKKKLAGDVWCTKSHADSQTSETCLHSGTGEQNETAVRYCGYMDDQFYYKLQYLNTGDRPAGQVSVNSQGAQAHTLTHSAMGSTGAMWGHGAARRPRQVKGQHRV